VAEFTGRLVLRPSFTEEDVDEMAWDLNWDLVHHKKPEGDSEVDIWLTKNKEVEIHLIDDRLVGLRYFTLRGDKGEEVASQIAEEGELWAKADALAEIRAASGKRDKLMATYAAVLAAGGQDEDVVDALRSVMRDSDPGIRQSVIVAAAYVQWPGLLELVQEMSQHEAVDTVRENARILLEGIRGGGGNS
jgi:hypothetical protein